MAGVLLRAGLSIYEDPSRARWWTFGSLIGLTILSKPNAWPLIPLACGLAWAGWCRDHARSWRLLAGVAVLAVVVAAPLRIVYPLSQEQNWQAGVQAMRAQRARPDLNPLQPTAPGFRLRAQGESFSDALLDRRWLRTTMASFYAVFGLMTTRPPRIAFVLVALLWLGLLTLNLQALRARPLRRDQIAILVGCGVTAALLAFAMAWRAWTVDYQAQGRYLFPALLPIALIICGVETPHRGGRRTLLTALSVLAVVTNFEVVPAIPDPGLSLFNADVSQGAGVHVCLGQNTTRADAAAGGATGRRATGALESAPPSRV